MARTYTHLPFNVSELFRSLIADVSANLGYEIKFYAETWVELCARMATDSTEPFICLIENFEEETRPNDPYIHTDLMLVIARKSEQTWNSETRLSTNFGPWLYPMYSETMEVIVQAPYFQGPHRPHPPHKVAKSYDLGTGDGNKSGFQLPSSYDALVITDLRLRVNRKLVAGFCYGPSCRIAYINNVQTITCAIASANSIEVALTRLEYQTLTPYGDPTYSVFMSHNESSFAFEPGDPIVIPVTAQPGNYYGLVQCADELATSSLAFFYCVNAQNEVYKVLTTNDFKLKTINTSGVRYPLYPITVETKATANKKAIRKLKISHDLVPDVFTKSFETPVNDTTVITTEIKNDSVAYRAVRQDLTIDSVGNTSFDITSFAYYQLIF